MREDRRVMILAALCLGLSFSWLWPCLLSLATGPLPGVLFIAWSVFIGLAALLLLSHLLDRWHR